MTFKDIVKIFEEMELRLVASLKRNLTNHKKWEKQEDFNWSAWQAEKLRNIETFRKQNREIVGEYTDVIDKETRQLMEEQFAEGEKLVDKELELLQAKNPDADIRSVVTDKQFFGVNTKKVKAVISDLQEVEGKAETAAVRRMDDIYRKTVAKVQISMATGEMTIEKAIETAVKDFAARGIDCIVYKNGARVNISDYMRMVLRTTSTRAQLQGEAQRRAELGYDTVLVSQYGACSETCLPWQGRAYIDDVFVDWQGETDGARGKSNYCGKWFPLLSSAVRAGLFHPNCRHTMTTWIDGVTAAPSAIDPAKIKETALLEKVQRKLENDIRRAKREELLATDPVGLQAARASTAAAQKRIRVFIGKHNDVLRRDYNREKIY